MRGNYLVLINVVDFQNNLSVKKNMFSMWTVQDHVQLML